MSFGIFSSKENSFKEKKLTINKRNIPFVVVFVFVMIAIIPIMEFVSLFLETKKKAFFWRKTAIVNIKFLFFFGCLKFKIEGSKPKEKKIIYISNHLSHLDGFILLCILGPVTTPIIAPVGYFGFPFSHWFKRMNFIDVQRSEIEKEKYQDSHSGYEAINEAMNELYHGHSILVFPEGHISFQKRLLYFHTGVARIALASETKIMPVAIINIDNLSYGKYFFQPGTVKIVFGDLVDAVKYYKENKASIKDTSKMLKIKISNLLPKEYIPFDMYEKNPKQTAAIFNINNTIYKGNALFDFLVLFWKNGELKFKDLIFLTFFIFLNRFNFISEHALIKHGAKIIKGWRVDKLYLKAHNMFHRYLCVNVSEKIKTIILDHKKKGHKIVFVTRMISPFAKLFADYLEADYYLAENLEEKELRFTGHLLGESKETDKGEQIKKLISLVDLKLNQSFAYGHDENDLPILELVKYKNLVNPKNIFLEKIKNKNKYEIVKT